MADRYVATSATPGTDVDGLGGGAVAAGDITDAGTVGVDLVQSETAADALAALGGAAALRALLLGPYAQAMAGSGWSSSGSGTYSAVWDGSKLDLSITSSAGTAAVAKAGVIDAEEYDLLIRFSMPTNNGGTQEQLYVAVGSSGSKNTALAVKPGGSFDCSRTNGGYVSIASPGGGPTGSQLTDGQSWLRLAKRAGTFAWYWGRGSGGARPLAESWDLVTTPSTNEAVMEAAAGDEVFIGAITDTSATIAYRVHTIQWCRAGAL